MKRLTDYLTEDHVRLQALLDRATATEQFDFEAYDGFRAGLLRHIGIEEKIFFPAAKEANGGVGLERFLDLRIGHAALTSLLVPTPDHALCDEIRSILHGHDEMEEGPNGVYEECEALIGPEASSALVERAKDYPPVKVAKHYDGPRALRTAQDALASANKMSWVVQARGTKQA